MTKDRDRSLKNKFVGRLSKSASSMNPGMFHFTHVRLKNLKTFIVL